MKSAEETTFKRKGLPVLLLAAEYALPELDTTFVAVVWPPSCERRVLGSVRADRTMHHPLQLVDVFSNI